MRHSVLLGLLIALPLPALAGTFTPPKGCTANLTVQSRGCIVSQFYTCEGDKTGDQWRADYDADGPFFLSKIDSVAQWLESYEFNPTTTANVPITRIIGRLLRFGFRPDRRPGRPGASTWAGT